MKDSKQKGEFLKSITQRRSYLLGVALGLILIALNAYIGLYMLDLILNDKQITVQQGITLPVIRQQEYEAVKKDILDRESKDLRPFSGLDPFNTSL